MYKLYGVPTLYLLRMSYCIASAENDIFGIPILSYYYCRIPIIPIIDNYIDHTIYVYPATKLSMFNVVFYQLIYNKMYNI